MDAGALKELKEQLEAAAGQCEMGGEGVGQGEGEGEGDGEGEGEGEGGWAFAILFSAADV
jgi:hypothetical protein